jgi:hypothetical protein
MAALIGSLAAGVPATQADEAHADGWRRTASGWERREDWYLESLPPAYSRREYFTSDDPIQAPANRWDFHPAALVTLQGLVIGAAFGLLAWGSNPKRSREWAGNGVDVYLKARARPLRLA